MLSTKDINQGGKESRKANPCTTMKNSSAKIMCFCTQGECEEDSTKLQLHCEKTDYGLQQESMEKVTSQQRRN